MARDRLSKERRSWNMGRIRGKNTSPELIVRRLLHRMGYRFRLHVRIPVPASALSNLKSLISNHWRRSSRRSMKSNPKSSAPPEGVQNLKSQTAFYVTPDIVLPKYKTVIFVHGCFWHRHKGCKNCTTPTNRRTFWLEKLNGNAARDKLHARALRKLGWRSITVWECQTERPVGIERFGRKLLEMVSVRLRNGR